MPDMFISMLATDPQYYFMWVLTVIVSITLHELAHGWAAIRVGDNTPIVTGHMTGNPVVHMGPISLAMVFLWGLGWGAMPVDWTRMRGRYSQAYVSLAGPAMNLFLAIVALTAWSLWMRFMPNSSGNAVQNGRTFLHLFGATNIGLAIFNLAPVPPLDGSSILADFHRPYREFRDNHADKAWLMFAAYFMIVSGLEGTKWGLWTNAYRIAHWYTSLWHA
ncbi:MAG: site-2 protease family protein [Planctomycetes bacterium]|nr:site-2 protease family protein [Planctomycetota bacterium]